MCLWLPVRFCLTGNCIWVSTSLWKDVNMLWIPTPWCRSVWCVWTNQDNYFAVHKKGLWLSLHFFQNSHKPSLKCLAIFIALTSHETKASWHTSHFSLFWVLLMCSWRRCHPAYSAPVWTSMDLKDKHLKSCQPSEGAHLSQTKSLLNWLEIPVAGWLVVRHSTFPFAWIESRNLSWSFKLVRGVKV